MNLQLYLKVACSHGVMVADAEDFYKAYTLLYFSQCHPIFDNILLNFIVLNTNLTQTTVAGCMRHGQIKFSTRWILGSLQATHRKEEVAFVELQFSMTTNSSANFNFNHT